MKRFTFFGGLLSLTLTAVCVRSAAAEEGRASLFVVDRSAEAGGAYAAYPASGSSSADREILCVAESPPGTTLLAIAFDRDEPHLGLAPVVAVQGGDSAPLRFPEGDAVWPHRADSPSVDLYVVVFSNGDPQLPWFAEYAAHLRKALAAGDRDAALLHSIAIRYRLSAILRQRSVDDYRVTFSQAEEEAPRRPPASIAGVTRGGPKKADTSNPLSGLTGVDASVSKPLSRLERGWQEESRAIPYAPASPGILIFPVAPPNLP